MINAYLATTCFAVLSAASLFVLFWLIEGIHYACYWVQDKPKKEPAFNCIRKKLMLPRLSHKETLEESLNVLAFVLVFDILWPISIPIGTFVCILLIVREIIRGVV